MAKTKRRPKLIYRIHKQDIAGSDSLGYRKIRIYEIEIRERSPYLRPRRGEKRWFETGNWAHLCTIRFQRSEDLDTGWTDAYAVEVRAVSVDNWDRVTRLIRKLPRPPEVFRTRGEHVYRWLRQIGAVKTRFVQFQERFGGVWAPAEAIRKGWTAEKITQEY